MADEPTAKRANTGAASPAPAVPVCKCLLLRYEYVPDILEKRAPHRAGHLAHWKKLADLNQVLLGGAFDPPEAALIVLHGIEREKLEAYVQEDPYVANGLAWDPSVAPPTVQVPSYDIKDWNVVVGSAMPAV